MAISMGSGFKGVLVPKEFLISESGIVDFLKVMELLESPGTGKVVSKEFLGAEKAGECGLMMASSNITIPFCLRLCLLSGLTIFDLCFFLGVGGRGGSLG